MSEGIRNFISSPLFLLTLTVGVYWGAHLLWRRYKWVLLNPLLVCSAVIILFLKLTGIDFETYNQANGILNFLLGLSVVALGYLLYENLAQIWGRELSILLTLLAGSLAGVLSVMGLALLFKVDMPLLLSLESKSVTMPIAVEITRQAGGIPAITALVVVFTGILGSLAGPWLLKALRITDPIARGLALGAASHAIGTARALQMGALEGAAAGAAIGLMGLLTALLTPILNMLI